MSDPSRIPLHDFHAEHGARFVPFSGWNMPVQYGSILDEHRAVREAAGLFDVSHMGEFVVTGSDAARFLDKLLVNAVRDLPVGKAVYSPMCAGDGGVVDDLIVYRIAQDEFLVCVNAGNVEKDYGWFLKQAARWELDVAVEDQSEAFALLALQGPNALAIMEAAGFDDAGAIRRFHHRAVGYSGCKLRVCRTGYTGEDGFEIYAPPPKAESLARLLMEVGEAHGLKLCGLGARDSLRLEAGLPLYGHELSDEITPLEAGLAWTVKLEKEDFIGKHALAEQKEKGVQRRVVHFRLPGRRIARDGTAVIDAEGDLVGSVLSGTQSPMTDGPIGSALIQVAAEDSDLFVDLRGNRIPLEIAKPPLHRTQA
ncbi:MAG: glycine cleavage system aminomethyltransferase GcvT [Opitutales bacterium]